MKGAQIILDEVQGREAAALMHDGQLEDFLIAPKAEAPPAPGAIFRAIADRPMKGQGGMMMRLPAGETALFRGARGLRPGQAVLVQVTSYTEPGKAVPVSDRLVFKGRGAIVTPGAPGVNISRQIRDEEMRVRLRAAAATEAAEQTAHGIILRSGAAALDPDEIALELDALLGLADQVMADDSGGAELLVDAPTPQEQAWRDWDPTAALAEGFEAHGVLDALDPLLSPRVTLSSGSMVIEPTAALVAIDVNTGSDFSVAAGLKANLAMARALPRQLRLRGLGGQITIDPAPSPKKDRRQIEQMLKAGFRADPVETNLAGWTPLGHIELQRKRERLPLDLETP